MIKTLRNKYQYMSVKLTIHGHLFFFPVKHKLFSGLEKAWGFQPYSCYSARF